MVSQCTKYEVSRFTRYEAVNGGAKCRKWGGLGWLGVTRPRSNFAEIFGIRKLESLCVVVCVILRLAVLTEHRLVTDGRTDGQTDRETQGHG